MGSKVEGMVPLSPGVRLILSPHNTVSTRVLVESLEKDLGDNPSQSARSHYIRNRKEKQKI